ncbi:MAG: type II secretion system protein [Gammaproteobacteria bacterium]
MTSVRDRHPVMARGVGRDLGFTLLEVLVAFLILTIVLTLALRVAGSISRASGLSSDYAFATMQAENVLAEAQLAGELAPGTTAGVADGQWHWRRRVSPYREPGRAFDANPAWQLVRIDVDVYWSRGGRERGLSVSTVRLSRRP